ncbi:MAG: hypothetical protein V4609_03385 [Pseudomonadota bacterium]
MSVPRVPPKFVPTLTEVVHRPADNAPTPEGGALVTEERLVQLVLQRLETDLDARIREHIAQLVLEQAHVLGPRLRAEMEGSVRQAIAATLAAQARGS